MGAVGLSGCDRVYFVLDPSSLQSAIGHCHHAHAAPRCPRGSQSGLFLPIVKAVLPECGYLQYALAVGALLNLKHLRGFLPLTGRVAHQAAQSFYIDSGSSALVDLVFEP